MLHCYLPLSCERCTELGFYDAGEVLIFLERLGVFGESERDEGSKSSEHHI